MTKEEMQTFTALAGEARRLSEEGQRKYWIRKWAGKLLRSHTPDEAASAALALWDELQERDL